MAYTQLQTMMDPAFPPGLQVYWRSDFLKGLTDDVIDEIVRRFEGVTSPLSAVLIEQFGGAVRRVPDDETAYPHRDAEFNLAIVARWADPSDADRHTGWARDFSEAMRPHARGVYVNYLGLGEGADRVRAAYGSKYDRLAALKRKYDPTNLFRLNPNVKPGS